jgi:hypothetical protein
MTGLIAEHISRVGWVQQSRTQYSPRIWVLLGSAIAPPNLRDINAFWHWGRVIRGWTPLPLKSGKRDNTSQPWICNP